MAFDLYKGLTFAQTTISKDSPKNRQQREIYDFDVPFRASKCKGIYSVEEEEE